MTKSSDKKNQKSNEETTEGQKFLKRLKEMPFSNDKVGQSYIRTSPSVSQSASDKMRNNKKANEEMRQINDSIAESEHLENENNSRHELDNSDGIVKTGNYSEMQNSRPLIPPILALLLIYIAGMLLFSMFLWFLDYIEPDFHGFILLLPFHAVLFLLIWEGISEHFSIGIYHISMGNESMPYESRLYEKKEIYSDFREVIWCSNKEAYEYVWRHEEKPWLDNPEVRRKLTNAVIERSRKIDDKRSYILMAILFLTFLVYSVISDSYLY